MQPPPEHELLEIVDENNRVIGIRNRAEIHREGLWHRSVHISIFNSRGELFLQKQSPHKDQYPEHWDSWAAGHLIPGESPVIAAHRELGEELGIDARINRGLPASGLSGNRLGVCDPFRRPDRRIHPAEPGRGHRGEIFSPRPS